MKRWLFVILTVLLLTGCGMEQQETTPPTEIEATQPQAVTEPVGYYDPGSALEADTGGAIRVYPLHRSDSYGLVNMDQDLLLLSGKEVTTLTKLSGSGLYVAAAANLDCYIDPESPAFHAGSKGVTYYDPTHRELVFLDVDLKEVSRISMPEDMEGDPALSADRKHLYYLTGEHLRTIDLENGLDKLIREVSSADHVLTALHWNDSILECLVQEAQGSPSRLFISVKTGETVLEYREDLSLHTWNDRYFAVHPDGEFTEFLVGSGDGEPSLLLADPYGCSAAAVPNRNGAVVYSTAGEALSLDYYDLETGNRTASISLPAGVSPWDFRGGEDNCVWFMTYDESYGSDTLCRWDLDKTAVSDTANTLSPRYTAAAPDTAGLAACQESADAIGETHGVEIILWDPNFDSHPEGYTMEPEYQTTVIRRNLLALDRALASYPEGFLKKAAAGTTEGKILIYLVRSISPVGSDTPRISEGIQFWNSNGDACVVVPMDANLEQHLYHTMFHVIDSYVMSHCSVYDTWEDLNPAGFSYTYSYTAQIEDASAFFEGSDVAFIDLFSMSFPREDRARIMEYAMTPGNESYFTSETMQRKLQTLCHGIRDAFRLKKATESFLWEQYLQG